MFKKCYPDNDESKFSGWKRGGYIDSNLYTKKKRKTYKLILEKNNPYIKDLSPKNMLKNLAGFSSHAKPSSFLPHLFGWIQVEPTEDIMIQPGIFQKTTGGGGEMFPQKKTSILYTPPKN